MYWTDSSGKIELVITKKQAHQGSHSGSCDSDIEQLIQLPAIKRQITKLSIDDVKVALEEYGAWTTDELSDHNENLARLLWIACGDIVECTNQ